MSNFSNEYVTMTDEDGNEFVMEHLDTLEHDDETYIAFGLVDSEINTDEDEIAVVIMKVVEQDNEEILEEVVDEILLEEVYSLFMERIEDDPEEDELE